MKTSAGILLYKIESGTPLYFLVHPGGPFWKNKDSGSWSVPKGEHTPDEDALAAALREFEEETGQRLGGDFIALKPVKLKSGKIITAWAVCGDIDAATVFSNTFTMEWPPKSGKSQEFPEIDKAGWFSHEQALEKLNAAQGDLVRQLAQLLENREMCD